MPEKQVEYQEGSEYDRETKNANGITPIRIEEGKSDQIDQPVVQAAFPADEIDSQGLMHQQFRKSNREGEVVLAFSIEKKGDCERGDAEKEVERDHFGDAEFDEDAPHHEMADGAQDVGHLGNIVESDVFGSDLFREQISHV